ncbi:ABC transporter permease [Xanthomonas sp. XNM01]|uniref:ABC transporter permease n=1 Tax=Xanthomonas sp. XNM01 TaxID=2769289 RepID=UPI001782F6B9|nr:ABC transporter permease [Xanthomonas sp. XNM01]MBD9369126.1 ABC transporter permease [Xanthomonas sp. XNM01]
MNAMTSTVPRSWMQTFGWLLRREYWENRGGFLWAQLISCGIALFFTVLVAVIGVIQVRDNIADDAPAGIEDLARYAHNVGAAADGILLTGFSLTGIVLAFVVFFYALGSLYDDRRDRSALFWKSLPVSDTQTVLSKAVWAALLAPVISVVVGLAFGLLLWIVAGVAMYASGAPEPAAIFTHAHPLRVFGNALITLPLGVLWSLPAVGWLMFCSAWVRSKPFLWAVLLPFLGCLIISIVGAMPGISVPHGTIWYVVVYRGLMSVIPGTWAPAALQGQFDVGDRQIENPGEVIRMVLEQTTSWKIYANLDLWIGVAVGVAFIAAAIYLRRWRDEA